MSPRRRVGDPEVRPLIERVAELALELGSVNRAQQALVERLAVDRSEGYIYPNRLHALLSEDPGKSINPGTVATLETAIARLDAETPDRPRFEPDPGLVADVRARWPGTAAATSGAAAEERIRHLASEVNLPAAAVRLLLGESAESAGRRPAAGAPNLEGEASGPDWSFQDTAYERCLQALGEEPGKKVGLVVPTGGGKTRLAIRILLAMLDRSELPEPRVVWVTHRKQLRTQATRELQRAVTRGTPDLPAHATALLAERVEFCMVSKLSEVLDRLSGQLALVVVDEAHHAAAASYQPIFGRQSLPGLFLTATPNRTDLLPIGIDEIAFSTTYRDLFDRGVVIEPDLGELTIDGFNWELPEKVDELASYLLDEAGDRFVKTMVVVYRVDQAESLYESLARMRPADHVLADEDIGFVHGSASSTGDVAQVFLDEFQARPRGILIATSALLGEGYDDPAVDTAVVTYPTGSMLELMQVAGRCMRYAAGKRSAQVVQVRDSALAYHWEQGWLYQDISDTLRPRIEKVAFGSAEELRSLVAETLDEHNASPAVRAAAFESLQEVGVNDRVSLLLTGLPFSGSAKGFDAESEWGAVLVPPSERGTFLRIFNAYSERLEEVNDTKSFLEQFLPLDPAPTSRWKRYVDMLAAMRAAAAERSGGGFADSQARPGNSEKGTTWLTYITFSYEPDLPAGLDAFLDDAINREEVAAAFLSAPEDWILALKVPLPLSGTVALLLGQADADWFERERSALMSSLSAGDPRAAFAAVAAWRAGLGASPLPQFAEDRFEVFLGDQNSARLTLAL